MSYSNPEAYQRYMGRWSTRLAPLFVQFAGVRDRQRILDVGCGTGSLARELLVAGSAVRVVGVDPTEDFLTHARRSVPDHRARFERSAAESLPFPDGSFDVAMALLVLQAMDDPARGVREMARVTRAGGCVAATVWDFQEGMPMTSMIWEAAEALAPLTVARHRAEHPPPRLGLPALEELWTSAGLAGVRTARLALRQEFTSFDDFWLPYLGESTPICQFAVAVNRETGGRLAEALRETIPDQRPDGSFVLQAHALAVAGVVAVPAGGSVQR
jgi:SAM-dependent methyltransferase